MKLLKNYDISFGKLKIVETYNKKIKAGITYPIKRVEELSPEQLRNCYNPRQLSEAEIKTLQLTWKGITHKTPHKLLELFDNPPRCLPFLYMGLKEFLMRYPNKTTGLNFHDYLLLKSCQENGPKVSSVIAHSLATICDLMDIVGSQYLFWRLKKLAAVTLSHAPIQLKGTQENIRETTVFVTDTGRNILTNRANFVRLNGINDWIGGVHLSSPDNIWFYDNGNLINPTQKLSIR